MRTIRRLSTAIVGSSSGTQNQPGTNHEEYEEYFSIGTKIKIRWTKDEIGDGGGGGGGGDGGDLDGILPKYKRVIWKTTTFKYCIFQNLNVCTLCVSEYFALKLA